MKCNIPFYELGSESFLTPQAMTGSRFTGRVPEDLLLTFHYHADVFKGLADRYRAMKCNWYRKDFSPFLLRNARKGWYLLPGVGAPALMYDLENLRACGAKRFVLFGKAGFLRHTRANIAVPRISYVDEGTSSHYIPSQESIEFDCILSRRIQNVLERAGCSVANDPVWTTDAIYRETPGRIEYFRDRGCLCVDMETSALFSFCKRYGLEGASVLYKSDSFSSGRWIYHDGDFNSEGLTSERLIELLIDGI